ncbi:MAG: signal peptidase I [Nitrosopumilus sp. B06]|nr:MAG: signal peptidase I [Nitrosopumilus sp. D6]RNJ79663.1 MAG: signal peptidase I [Nitrosopumilus sp. B06]
MAKSSSKTIIRDIVIIAVGVVVIWIGLQAAFGTQNPFYVVASGSMIPALEVYDVIIVQGHDSFEDLVPGDIIVFNRPSDHSKVIVHRVASITDENPREIRTKGDANSASIPGTDFPITEDDYIGKVVYTISQIGYITQLIKPPVNYIIIVIVIGIMIARHFSKRKKVADSEIPDVDSDPEYYRDNSKKDNRPDFKKGG